MKCKKTCEYPNCPNLADGPYCEVHKKLLNKEYEKNRRRYKTSERYGSAWMKIRNAYINTHPLCEECLEKGRYVKAEEVHHIKPIEEGGTNEISNLKSLCSHCHRSLHRRAFNLKGRGRSNL